MESCSSLTITLPADNPSKYAKLVTWHISFFSALLLISLQLLGELLLDRANFSIMTRYISNEENLKLMMIMLGDKKRTIQFEVLSQSFVCVAYCAAERCFVQAFHVFKVFVANPNKPAPILAILVNNKEKLISFLSNFHNDKGTTQQTHSPVFFFLSWLIGPQKTSSSTRRKHSLSSRSALSDQPKFVVYFRDQHMYCTSP
jgi:hypothetical protein